MFRSGRHRPPVVITMRTPKRSGHFYAPRNYFEHLWECSLRNNISHEFLDSRRNFHTTLLLHTRPDSKISRSKSGYFERKSRINCKSWYPNFNFNEGFSCKDYVHQCFKAIDNNLQTTQPVQQGPKQIRKSTIVYSMYYSRLRIWLWQCRGRILKADSSPPSCCCCYCMSARSSLVGRVT